MILPSCQQVALHSHSDSICLTESKYSSFSMQPDRNGSALLPLACLAGAVSRQVQSELDNRNPASSLGPRRSTNLLYLVFHREMRLLVRYDALLAPLFVFPAQLAAERSSGGNVGSVGWERRKGDRSGRVNGRRRLEC